MPSIKTLVREHPSFPTALRDVPAWPTLLHCHGTLSERGPAVAIVGARAASRNGMQRACELAEDLAGMGYRIISGGALGIDTAAHRGALRGGGHTVAVMACGLDQYYPQRNQRLFEAIVESGGAVVSPFEERERPLRGRFVKRNQIIAALAELVVVVEASTNSGSLHTARFARKLGRKLAVVPGTPGCEALLAQGVPAIANAGEASELMLGQMRRQQVSLPAPESPEGRVLHALCPRRAQSAAQLHGPLDLTLRAVQRVLLRLQLDLLAVALPGQCYRRSQLAERAMHPELAPAGKEAGLFAVTKAR